MGVLITILTVVLIVNCLGLVGLILIQRGKGGGLAAAFGGGGMEQAFGTRAATLAQKATALMAVIFLVLSIALGLMYQRRHVVPPPAMQEEPMDSQPSDATAPSAELPGAPSASTDALPAPTPAPEAE